MTDLYKLTQDMQELELECFHATDPDTAEVSISDEKMAKFFSLQDATHDKVDNYVHLMENLEIGAKVREAEYKAHKEAIEKHRDAAKAARNRIKRLKDWMKLCMIAVEKAKIETDHFTVAIQLNGGVPTVNIPPDPDFKTWPEELIEIISSPDIEAIREWAAEKKDLPEDVEVFRGTHIRIR